MPPRNRKPADTIADTPVFVEPGDPTEPDIPEQAGQDRKPRKDRVKAENAVILTDFEVVDSAPAVTRKTARDNPFLDAVAKSYEADLEGPDQWMRFRTTVEDAENQARLIRAAAALLSIGSAVRIGDVDQSTGETAPEGQTFVWFRGQAKKARAPKPVE